MTPSLAPLLALRAGRYRLLSQVRTGGSGVVWRGVDTRDNVAVALKAVPVEGGGAQAVEHEAEAAARVQHPGVLRVHAAFVEGAHGFIVMDLLCGSLADLVEVHGPLPASVALRVAHGLAETLGAAHAAGVVHRDVKPHNVLLDGEGRVYLGDWGIARVVASGHAHTRSGALLGTLAYMAPEQKRHPRDVRPATDVYALAATLAFMLVGEAPGELYVPDVEDRLRARLGTELAGVVTRAGRHAVAERPAHGAAYAACIEVCGVAIAGEAEAAAWLAPRARALDGLVDANASGRGAFDDAGAGTLGVGDRHDAGALRGARPPPQEDTLPRTSVAERASRVDGVERPVLRVVALAALALALAGGAAWLGWARGVEEARQEAARDPVAELPTCPDAPTQWVARVERGPRETMHGDIVDVDGDGVQDVIFANQYSENATVWWGLPAAFPKEHTEIATGRTGRVPAVGDVDGDGILDLVAPQYDDSRLAYLRGRGERRWDAPISIFQGPGPFEVALADVDGDGRADLGMTHLRDPSFNLRRAQGPRPAGAPPFGTDLTIFARHVLLSPTPEGVAPARVLVGTKGMAAWAIEGTEIVRFPVTGADAVGRSERFSLPTEVRGILRDASHPDAVIAVVREGVNDALVRTGPGVTACGLGAVAQDSGLLAAGDLDGDGLLDTIGARTCQFCDSNHVFSRGVR